ncbi:MAG: hypothetical protein ACFN25_06795, partial [Leptotrichia wadei]
MRKQKTDLQIKKDEIRRQILEKRNNLSSREVDKKSELIIENLAPYLKNAQNGWHSASYNDAVVAFSSEKALMMPQGS